MTLVKKHLVWFSALACTITVAPALSEAANNPAAVFGQYAALVNTGDKAGLSALIADMVTERPAFAGCAARSSNRDCLITFITATVMDRHGVISSTDYVAVEGQTVYGALELRSDAIHDAGVDRIVGIDKIVVQNNKIVSLKFLPNTADYQTRRFFNRIAGK